MPGKAKRGRGRPGLEPNEEQDRALADLWFGPYLGPYVLTEARRIMGAPVPRNALYYRYGPRSGGESPRERWQAESAARRAAQEGAS